MNGGGVGDGRPGGGDLVGTRGDDVTPAARAPTASTGAEARPDVLRLRDDIVLGGSGNDRIYGYPATDDMNGGPVTTFGTEIRATIVWPVGAVGTV